MNLYEQIEKECLSDGLDFEHQRCNTTKLKAICAEFERRAPAPEQDKPHAQECELAASILRGAISALHSMNDPIQENARQQIRQAIAVLNAEPQAQAEPVADSETLFNEISSQRMKICEGYDDYSIAYVITEKQLGELEGILIGDPIPAAPAVPESWRAVIDAMRRQYVPNSLGDDLLFHVAEELEKLTASPEQQP